jgi:hypothetical protein
MKAEFARNLETGKFELTLSDCNPNATIESIQDFFHAARVVVPLSNIREQEGGYGFVIVMGWE